MEIDKLPTTTSFYLTMTKEDIVARSERGTGRNEVRK